ncbi:hypothetical protein VE04_08036 [Pseudogymnoascus sp. 24MN13]|nr:hypothetical protein VE04_08036 [Pseudogymnoascus sp. 24MN13]
MADLTPGRALGTNGPRDPAGLHASSSSSRRDAPRRGEPGRPKQSRVKGLARAVLDTIPIVKFGESYDRDADGAAHGDDELAGAGETNRTQATTSQTNTSPTLPVTAAGRLSAVGTVGVECSICTEDFVNSEDIRVLPCNHKFHPTCIDPWLLNISGTCPLCRMDLCPTITSDNTANSANDFLSPPLGDEADIAESRSRISRYNDLRHAAHSGPEVRLAALRGLYQSHRASASAPAERWDLEDQG